MYAFRLLASCVWEGSCENAGSPKTAVSGRDAEEMLLRSNHTVFNSFQRNRVEPLVNLLESDFRRTLNFAGDRTVTIPARYNACAGLPRNFNLFYSPLPHSKVAEKGCGQYGVVPEHVWTTHVVHQSRRRFLGRRKAMSKRSFSPPPWAFLYVLV